jgi:hypothetical protein
MSLFSPNAGTKHLVVHRADIESEISPWLDDPVDGHALIAVLQEQVRCDFLKLAVADISSRSPFSHSFPRKRSNTNPKTLNSVLRGFMQRRWCPGRSVERGRAGYLQCRIHRCTVLYSTW